MRLKVLFFSLFMYLFFCFNMYSMEFDSQDAIGRLGLFVQSGNLKSASRCANSLFLSSSDQFVKYVHSNLVFDIKRPERKINSIQFLRELYKQDKAEITKILTPIYYYQLISDTKSKDSLDLLLREYNIKIEMLDNTQSRTELYSLLILKCLSRNKYVQNELTKTLLDRSIANLRKNKTIDLTMPTDDQNSFNRGWSRYLLSNLYYYSYKQTHGQENQDLLKNAYTYGVDEFDLKSAYKLSSECSLLWGSYNHLGFDSEYAEYLLAKGKSDEALEVLTHRAVLFPSDENIKKLKMLFTETVKIIPFTEYWNNSVEKSFKPVFNAKFKTLDGQKISLINLKGSWVYIDVWGTWCAPCRKDLPSVQSFYDNNLKIEHSALKIYTLSYNSTDLEDYLKENQFTFPVASISDYTVKGLNINSFPSKLLVTPNGNVIHMPFGFKWKELVANYCQISLGD